VPAGASTSPTLLYEDTKAGAPVITAAATGLAGAAQAETLNPAALASIAVAPGSATVSAGATQAFSATGADAYGNAVAVAGAAWAVSPSSLGTLSTAAGGSTVFTAAATAASGSVTATVGTVTGSAAVTVAPKPTVPGSPTQLVAVTAASRGVSLTWKAPASQGSSPVTSYRLYRGTRSGGETLLATVGNVLGYTDSSAPRGAISFYTVAAVSTAGQSPMSGEASARAR
jgi:hypothetical protein